MRYLTLVRGNMLTLPAGSTRRRELAAVLHCGCATPTSPVQLRTNSIGFHTRLVYFLFCGIAQCMPLESVLLLCSGDSIMLSCLSRFKPRAIAGSKCQSSASYEFTLVAVTDDSKYAGFYGHQYGAEANHSAIKVEFLVDGKWSAAEVFIANIVVPFDVVRVAFVTESRPTKLKFTNSETDGWGFKALALQVGPAETEIPVPARWKGGAPGGWVKAGENKNAELEIPSAAVTQPPGQSIVPQPENKSDAKFGPQSIEELRTWPYRFVLQQDGNLVLYQDAVPQGVRWTSNTAGKGEAPFKLFLQGDGNLVVYDKNGTPTWASNSRGNNCVLRLQGDGNLVIYDGAGHAKWHTRTGNSLFSHNCAVACQGKTGPCDRCGKPWQRHVYAGILRPSG